MKHIAHSWIENDPDPDTRQEIQHLLDSDQTLILQQRLNQRLQFGTAGLRGEMGAGLNRMNRLVILQTTVGLAEYLQQIKGSDQQQSVVVGYDGRHQSQTFAEDVTRVLCAYGIRVYLLDRVCPTPLISFGIPTLGCDAGIMITASHNPPEYNGFKLYWRNGAQINAPHHLAIQELIEKHAFKPIKTMELVTAENQKRLVYLNESYIKNYLDYVLSFKHLSSQPASCKNISVAYTALHGVGYQITQQLMSALELKHFYTVENQAQPNGDFPTVAYPNPENRSALQALLNLAQQHKTQLAFAHDPDADRLAVAVRDDSNAYQVLTGDQIGCLLADYLLTQAADPKSACIGNSLVSSSMLKAIVAAHQAHSFQTLTGFKWLANTAQAHTQNKPTLAFAYEEALGYMFGDLVWDKDGVHALIIFIEMVAKLQQQNLTIFDKLTELYRKHGLYLHQQVSVNLTSENENLMQRLRTHLPTHLGAEPVQQVEDLLNVGTDGLSQVSKLPPCDMLIYHLPQCRIIVRPSGTEPKLKFYYEWRCSLNPHNDRIDQQTAQNELNQFIAIHQQLIFKP
ncbi:MAG: phospho-sugar mutase [Shewanellaceae bacterium]|nr:phospho-sugar mutase [Shewanellaceae bacterium]